VALDRRSVARFAPFGLVDPNLTRTTAEFLDGQSEDVVGAERRPGRRHNPRTRSLRDHGVRGIARRLRFRGWLATPSLGASPSELVPEPIVGYILTLEQANRAIVAPQSEPPRAQ
jgi:hypothetical protein